jgi:hypothetical protein
MPPGLGPGKAQRQHTLCSNNSMAQHHKSFIRWERAAQATADAAMRGRLGQLGESTAWLGVS